MYAHNNIQTGTVTTLRVQIHWLQAEAAETSPFAIQELARELTYCRLSR